MEQQLLQQSVQLRMGTDKEPGRCESVDAEKWRRQWSGSGCARSFKEARSVHADDGSSAALRPCLRKNLAPIFREPRPICRCIRACMVQTDTPRHGPSRPLPRPTRSEGRAAVAGSYSSSESCSHRRAGYRCSEGKDSRVWPDSFPVSVDSMGVGINFPRLRQARRGEWRAYSALAAKV